MPFAVWCTTCKPHETIIGQGVRFNAEKKKIGNYYSTPIYSFRMKHTACGGWIEIQTDPQHTAYVVVEGGRKRDTGEDRELQPGEIAIRPPGSADQANNDPFSKLEGKVEDKQRAQTETTRILELQRRQDRDWDDPYENSKRLRRSFRSERKGLEKAQANREALQDKMSLGIDLVDETEEDRRRAGVVDFGDDQEAIGMVASRATRARPMFESRMVDTSPGLEKHEKREKPKPRSAGSRAADQAAQRKASLRHELTGNTRAVVDPFLNDPGDGADVWRTGLKRKKPASAKPSAHESQEPASDIAHIQSSQRRSCPPSNGQTKDSRDRMPTPAAPTLVSYDSDSN